MMANRQLISVCYSRYSSFLARVIDRRYNRGFCGCGLASGGFAAKLEVRDEWFFLAVGKLVGAVAEPLD